MKKKTMMYNKQILLQMLKLSFSIGNVVICKNGSNTRYIRSQSIMRVRYWYN